jgi:YHS domain-containing protein
MFSTNSRFKFLSLLAIVLFSQFTFAANIDMNVDANDVTLHGYDTVAYFTKSKPVKGSNKFVATYKNAIYHFANEENRDLFRGNPMKYAPQFGGYCGMGVALEKKLDVDPNAFTIVDGKLYMNLNLAVRKKWSEDIPGNIMTANENWIELKTIPAEEL